jgi:hypothetical protein
MMVPESMLRQQGAGASGSQAPAAAGPQQPQANQALEQAPDGSMKNPMAAIQALKSDRDTLNNIKRSNPPLGQAIESEDIDAFQVILRKSYQ